MKERREKAEKYQPRYIIKRNYVFSRNSREMYRLPPTAEKSQSLF